MRWGIVPLRVVIGVIFLFHGAQKVFAMGHPAVARFLSRVGIPDARAAAVVVMAVEFVGGIALILGAGTRVASSLIAIEMVVALLVVHVKVGFAGPNGAEFPLTLLAGALTLALLGSGAASVDALVRRRRG